jgi:mitotic spindle assembly checkpoint protein MAD1
LQRQFDSLSESYEQLDAAATKANRECESAQRQLTIVQEGNEFNHSEAAKYRKLAQERAEEIEMLREAARAHSETPRADGTSKELEIMRSEILQQTEHVRKLEDANAKMQGELLVLRERHQNIEVLREEKRVLERRVWDADLIREQLGAMEAQVEALRQERENS